ncbi:hypothetical protein [Microbacterium sp. 1P10AE]|uniref:hypothetical protein n=1 Tax=Microbacterium sp. 1P10AE TaxID=3132286 RepID=UPI0039A3790F
MQQSIERAHLTIGGVTHALAPTEDVRELKDGIVQAIRAGGDFVEVTIDTGQRLSFLIAAPVSVVISVETVPIAADTADRPTEPWRPGYDYDIAYDDDTPYDTI